MSFRSKAKTPSDWRDGDKCEQCGNAFSYLTWTNRKHHCRSCGGIFCDRCSSQTKVVPKYGSHPVRVCDGCVSKSATEEKQKPLLGQSPPGDNSPMMRTTIFDRWAGDEEPIAVWVADPKPYFGASPPPRATSPEFFIDQDMDLKTISEMEEADRERELKEFEEKRARKEEKRRQKERQQFVAGEKERINAEKRGEEPLKEETTRGQFDNEGGQTPPSENDNPLMFEGLSITDSIELPSSLAPASPQVASEGHGGDTLVLAPAATTTTTPTDNSRAEATGKTAGESREGSRRRRGSSLKRKTDKSSSVERRRSARKVVDNSLRRKAEEFTTAFYCGLRDSMQLKYTFLTLSRSNTAFYRSRDVFILNILLLGSYMLFFKLVAPHCEGMLYWKEHTFAPFSFVVSIVNFLLSTIFWLLWLLPLFLLSIVLNAHWCEGIAHGSFGLHIFWKKGVKVNVDNRSLATVIGEALYRNLIFGAFLALGQLCYIIPWVGAPLYFLSLCWIYSVYCYEYKWNNQSWGLNRKLKYFETRWIYFAGFGTPIAIVSYFLDYFTGYALISLLFPVFIPIAMYGNPSKQQTWQPIPLSRFVDSSILTPVIRLLKAQFRVPG